MADAATRKRRRKRWGREKAQLRADRKVKQHDPATVGEEEGNAVGESGATQCNAIPKRAPEIAEQEAAPGTRDNSESAAQRVDVQRRPKRSEDD